MHAVLPGSDEAPDCIACVAGAYASMHGNSRVVLFFYDAAAVRVNPAELGRRLASPHSPR